MAKFIQLICPACQGPFEIMSDRAVDDVHCPACRAVVPVQVAAAPASAAEPPLPMVQEWEGTEDKSPRRLPPPRRKAKAGLFRWLAVGVGLLLMVAVGCWVYFAVFADPGSSLYSGKDKTNKKLVPNPVPGKLPQKDPQKEAELAKERAKKIVGLQEQEKKIMETLKKWPGQLEGQHGQLANIQFVGNNGALGVEGQLASNGSLLAVQERDFQTQKSEFKIFDLVSGKKIGQIPYAEGGTKKWLFSPDGSLFAQGGFDKQIEIWDVKQGKIKNTFPVENQVWHLAFAPDGKTLLASIGGKLVVLDSKTGQVRKVVSELPLVASYPVFSPSGSVLAAAVNAFDFKNDRVVLWEVATGGKIQELDLGGSVSELVFSPDGWQLLLITSQKTGDQLVLWDLETNQRRVLAEASVVASPVFSPDGKYVAYRTASLPPGGGLHLMDIATGKEVCRVPKVVGQLTFFPGGSMLAIWDNSMLRVWAVADLLKPKGEKPVAVPALLEGEAKAIALVKKLGGMVGQDENLPGKPVVNCFVDAHKITDDVLQQFGAFKNLYSLNLAGAPITDAGMIHLAGLKELRTLWLDNTKINDAALEHLAGLKHLEGLGLSRTGITGVGLEHLAELEGLRHLFLAETKVGDLGLEHLCGLQKLEKIDLEGTSASNDGLIHVAKLRNLQHLLLSHTAITDTGLQQLSGLHKLQSLLLNDTKVTGTGVKVLASLQSLETLSLSKNHITEDGLKEIGRLQSLRKLILANTNLPEGSLKSLVQLKSLQLLSLSGSNITDTDMSDLTNIKPLRELWLYDTKIGDTGLKGLSKLENLVSLDLGGSMVTNHGLNHLGKILQLEILSLNRTQISDAGLLHLSSLKGLISLDLSETNATHQGVTELRKALPKCGIHKSP